MPELPEVETIRRDLAKKVINKKIATVKIKKRKLIRGKVNNFNRVLLNSSFDDVSRIGKLLILSLRNTDYFLLIHLKMTGQLIYVAKGKITGGGHSWKNMSFDLPNKYSHVYFGFKDKSMLFFNDMRQFGYMKLVTGVEKDQIIADYGIEPLAKNFTLANFRKALKNRRVAIKTILLNQKVFAGIGNIYADEACFMAGVRPSRRAGRLTNHEIKRLHQASNSVIKKAILKRGTTFSNYVDSSGKSGNFIRHLKVYQREGGQCFRCKVGLIKKITINGRGTRYCPNCQK